LGDAKDITVKGLEIVKKCDKVYLEAYTSILTIGKDVLEEFYGRPLISADRELCESSIDEILKEAKTQDIALL
ncbi:Diphthine synthase, partial [Operophtera brumata]